MGRLSGSKSGSVTLDGERRSSQGKTWAGSAGDDGRIGGFPMSRDATLSHAGQLMIRAMPNRRLKSLMNSGMVTIRSLEQVSELSRPENTRSAEAQWRRNLQISDSLSSQRYYRIIRKCIDRAPHCIFRLGSASGMDRPLDDVWRVACSRSHSPSSRH